MKAWQAITMAPNASRCVLRNIVPGQQRQKQDKLGSAGLSWWVLPWLDGLWKRAANSGSHPSSQTPVIPDTRHRSSWMPWIPIRTAF